MISKSPTQRSLELLRSRGYTCVVVEVWNGRHKRDLFGILDILALGSDTIGCQTTDKNHLKNRLEKVRKSPYLPALKRAGWAIEVHGWKDDTPEIVVI